MSDIIYPNIEIDISNLDRVLFKTNIYVYGNIEDDNKREVYICPVLKMFKIPEHALEEELEILNNYISKEVVRCIRFMICSKEMCNHKGEPLFKYIGKYSDQEIIIKDLV